MNIYDVGNDVVLSGTFTAAGSGLPAVPSTVTLKVEDPTGAKTTYTGGQITTVATGIYQYVIFANTPGVWNYRFEGSGAVVGAGDCYFGVKPSPLSP